MPCTCQYEFKMPEKPRQYCGLPAKDGGFCCLHSPDRSDTDYIEFLINEVRRPDHWLEGARIRHDLKGIVLSGARMPRAVFEGARIESVTLDFANLEGAIFRSTQLSNVSFAHSNLQHAVFDRAASRSIAEYSIDFRDADLGGASFEGAKIDDVRMEGVIFSKPTEVAMLLSSTSFEEKTGNWEAAAAIYSAIGKRAREDWDILSEDRASFGAMECKHRRMIASPPAVGNYFLNWIVPTAKGGLQGIWWYLQRVVWGYGYRPIRVVITILLTILVFAFLFALLGDSSPIDAALLSAQSFFTVTFGKSLPSNKICEALGTIEAFVGTTLVSLFVVSLASRFMRRM